MSKARQQTKSNYMLVEGIASILINITLFIYKYVVGMSLGSLAIMADAWHTLSDCLSSGIVIVGSIYSKRPADQEHPFGHGRAELITSFLIGVMLIFVAYSFGFESIKNFMSKNVANFDNRAIGVMLVSVVSKEALAQFAFFGYRKTDAHSLYADGWHHRSDALTSIVILIGIVFGGSFWWMDSVLTFLISLIILYAGFDVIKGAVKPLIGETLSDDLIESIKNIVSDCGGKGNTTHHFHLHRYGEHAELTFHVLFDGNVTVHDAHEVVTKIEIAVKEKLNMEATIHIETE